MVISNNTDPDQAAPKSGLIRVHGVCSHDKIQSIVHLNICSRHKSRQHFQDKNSDVGKRVHNEDGKLDEKQCRSKSTNEAS